MSATIGTAELCRSIVDRWEAGQLDRIFRQYWAIEDREQYSALHSEEAGAEQPWPYAIWMLTAPLVRTRMSAGGGGGYAQKNEIRDIPLEFHIYAKAVAGEPGYDAQELAAMLAAEVLAVYGGHPTRAAAGLDGSILTQYVTDFGVRDGDSEWHWMIRYLTKIDAPVAAIGP